ncbi:hypothetical protein HIM_08240 [Hirsutella minnesotensis 3608]|uniref:Myb-like domain-containing protein n=1 Tax=Hirsutella minnesotensis 3608 TaxID=1043627 RepID=A0A0F8A3S0_9HYPO|nr:hypothetical protein HIM_08240 [Hirsutella minnesotensis 3608]
MSVPLKFKPYVPAPQRQRKKNHPAPASHGHRRDVTLPEAGGGAQSLQSRSAGFINMQGREDMATLDLNSLDWPDETQSFSQPMQRCYASKADGKEIDENLRISSNCISFLAPVDSESIQGDAQNQGIQVGNGTDDQRGRKRQSLLSIAEDGMYQPSICDAASTVAHDPVDAHDRCRRLLPVRRMNSNYSNSCDDDRPAAKALTHDPTQCSHLAMTDRGDPNGPTVGIRSDAAAFSAESSKQHVSHPYYYTMAGQPRTAGTMWSPLVELPPAVPFGEAQEMEQTGQCKSCVIFRAALFESLSLLHRPLTGGVSRKARRDQREAKILKHHHNLRRRSMAPNSSCEDNSDTESPSCTDEDRLQVDEDSERGDDDASDSLSVKLGTRRRLAKRRRWSALEERRLTAWKRESKSESWIASKLNRTESAVKQQWRKMSDK